MSSPSSHDDDALLRALGAHERDDRAASDEASSDASGGRVPAFDDAMAERIAAKILAAPPSAAGSASASASVSASGTSKSEAPSNVVALEPKPRSGAPLSRPLPRRFFFVMGPIAAAAAILLVLAMKPADTLLPGYEMSVVAAKTTRSDPNAPTAETVLDPAGDFELVARPAVPSPRVTVRALLVREGKAAPWNVPTDVSPDGAVRIVGKNSDLFENPRGRATVVLLLASGARQPSIAEARNIAEGKRAPDAALRVVRADLRFLDP